MSDPASGGPDWPQFAHWVLSGIGAGVGGWAGWRSRHGGGGWGRVDRMEARIETVERSVSRHAVKFEVLKQQLEQMERRHDEQHEDVKGDLTDIKRDIRELTQAMYRKM